MGRRRWALAPAFVCVKASLQPADIAITIITSSPVQDARLPALRETWLGGAAARCAAALVVSDAAVRCDEDGPCVASVAVDCAASHAGLPCKSARALEASLAAAPRARWHVRVMDDTYVDVDALAWHLGDLDDAEPWYVGDTVAVPREGAGLCGNQPLVWGVPTKLQNCLAPSNRCRFGWFLDESIALVEFSKQSQRACVETFKYAYIEVGLKI